MVRDLQTICIKTKGIRNCCPTFNLHSTKEVLDFMERILFLGEAALFNWETLMMREKIIKSFNMNFFTNRQAITLPNNKVYDKKLLYFFMVLFDKFSSVTKSAYDLTTLNNLGLIDMDGLSWEFHTDRLGIQSVKTDLLFTEDIRRYYEAIAKDLMYINKNRIIKFLDKDSRRGLKSRLDKDDYVYIDHFNIAEAKMFYNHWVQEPDNIEVGELYTPTAIKLLRESISRGLYLSDHLGQTYYDGNLSINKAKVKILDTSFDINCILSLDLTPLLCEFPIPRNMKDVLYLRSRPEIKSFREIFFYWCDCIKQEEYDIAEKVKKDILSAQNALAKYSEWEKRKVGFLFCTIDALLSQIPYLSNILGFVAPYSLRNTLKLHEKNSWVSLLR